jgi:hypothetical protein
MNSAPALAGNYGCRKSGKKINRDKGDEGDEGKDRDGDGLFFVFIPCIPFIPVPRLFSLPPVPLIRRYRGCRYAELGDGINAFEHGRDVTSSLKNKRLEVGCTRGAA